ncbi:MAG: histidine kinase dimerization/phosphoacceptor domain -containing protein [Chitinophagaceae bacterium]
MCRIILFCLISALRFCSGVQGQSPVQLQNQNYTYYHPSKDKLSWQQLNLSLSSTYIVIAKEGQVGHDSCLYIASRSLGLSRFAVLAEGIDTDGELIGQSQWIDQQKPEKGMQLLSGATGIKQLKLLLLVGSYYAFEPRNYYKHRDKVEYYLNKAVALSKTLNEGRLGRIALCLLGKMYFQVNDSKGDSIFNKLVDECRKAGDKETEARAYAYRGIYTAPDRETLQRKLNDLQLAAGLYDALGDREREINVLTDLGYMLFVTGQLQQAYEILSKSLTLANSIHFPYTHYNTEALAMCTLMQGKFGEPLRYTFQTIKVAESCRDSIGWGYFYSRLAECYDMEGREKESLAMSQKAIHRYIMDRDPSVYNVLLYPVNYMNKQGNPKDALNLVYTTYREVGDPSNISDEFFYNNIVSTCHMYLGNLDTAEFYLKKIDSLETIAEAIRGPLRRTTVNDGYGIIAFKRGQFRKAREYFEKRFNTVSYGDRGLSDDLNSYRWLLSVDSALGDKASAITHYKIYTQLLDSNFRVTKIRQAEELQVLYETQEKENEISLLNQQAKLEKSNLKQERLVRDLTLAGGIAVLIIAGLLFRQNRSRKKNNIVITENNKEITSKNSQLLQLLNDREWLLKEIHHRVKNNLQIVMSLLNSQSVYINNDAALTAIHDSQRRVYAMSLIHQKLYQSENISTIVMPDYVNELVSNIKDSFDIGTRIVFDLAIEPVNLDVSQAIPLGLIINESIVNAIKYAFPDPAKGYVSVSLKSQDNGHLMLTIADNGVGLPGDLSTREHSSLGLDLIRGLTKQLDGSISINNNSGLQIIIVFPLLSKQISDGKLAHF